MSDSFLELLGFLLVAGLIFYTEHDTPQRHVAIAKLILASACAVWILIESMIKIAEVMTRV